MQTTMSNKNNTLKANKLAANITKLAKMPPLQTDVPARPLRPKHMQLRMLCSSCRDRRREVKAQARESRADSADRQHEDIARETED